MLSLRKQFIYGGLFWLLLLLTAAVYFPGLKGAFLLDDGQNLRFLQDIVSPFSFDQLIPVFNAGIATSLGRPISTLSFALQYASWPSDAGSFKYVNVMIHLLCGCMLYWFGLRAAILAGLKSPYFLALAATTLWLLHPLQVSTVLYVVQRMTELSALFTIMGLLLYVGGRKLALDGRNVAGYFWMSVGVVLGGVLATLSKETGVLLPLYVAVLEGTLFLRLPRPPRWNVWALGFIVLPLMLVLLAFTFKIDVLLGGYAQRDFSLGERLLTQARVLLDYAGKIVLPRPHVFGLFFDDYPVSRGWLAPPATLPAVISLATLAVSAFVLRWRAPVYSFAVLWFFAGHLIESTAIPLELYFEHRNYLPMAGPLFALIYYGRLGGERLSSPVLRKALIFLAMLMGALLALMTWQESRLWGQPLLQAAVWAGEKPDSRRAQEQYGEMLALQGAAAKAEQQYAGIAQKFSQDAGGYLQWVYLGCHYPAIDLPPRAALYARLATGAYSTTVTSALDGLVELKIQRRCGRLQDGQLISLIEAVMENPAYAQKKYGLYYLLGKFYASRGDPEKAVKMLDEVYALNPRAIVVLQQVKYLAEAGKTKEAEAYLVKARWANRGGLLNRIGNDNEITKWETHFSSLNQAKAGHNKPQAQH